MSLSALNKLNICPLKLTKFLRSKKVTSEYLRGYFESASGDVSDVSIDVVKLENDHEIRVAYVTFLMAEDAAR